MADLQSIDTFGDVSAENDTILEYFLKTQAVEQVQSGASFLVLGRKGTGKTAIVRYLTESGGDGLSKDLNLRNYPWRVHETRVDSGASENDAYISSWRYLIAIQLASTIVNHSTAKNHPSTKKMRKFLADNYGGPSPTLSNILLPESLQFSKFSLEPEVLGNKLGSISMERGAKNHRFGVELNAITDSLIDACLIAMVECSIGPVSFHFDELDQGISKIDHSLKHMLIGLIQAAKEFRVEMRKRQANVNVVVYLRDDLWDQLAFSDKNKITENSCLKLSWASDSLLDLVNARITAKLGASNNWDSISDDSLMRGAQTKWNHILTRTFLRPRDVIRFLNAALDLAKKAEIPSEKFTNKDITGSRNDYSRYLKSELDDEIKAHWSHWDEALGACSAIATITFTKTAFIEQCDARKSKENNVSADEALEILHKFSVIGYGRRSGYGGQIWAFQYINPEFGWDRSATTFKVHLGLKEYAQLREERQIY